MQKTILKSKHFTQKETQLLSGFTRDQLRTLYLSNIVVPYKQSTILYTWNQIIFLRVLFELRDEWSFYQIKTAITNYKKDITEAIEKINDYRFAILLDKDDLLSLTFKTSELDVIYTQQMFVSETESVLHHTVSFSEGNIVVNEAKKCTVKSTTITIPLIISDLKFIAKESNLENFDLKIQ